VCLWQGNTVESIESLLASTTYQGFPVVTSHTEMLGCRALRCRRLWGSTCLAASYTCCACCKRFLPSNEQWWASYRETKP